MNETEIVEFRNDLKEFEAQLKGEIQQDPDYAGEVDTLLQAITRLHKDFETIKTSNDFDAKFGSFARDLITVQNAAEMLCGDEESDFDLDELDGEDDFDDEDFEEGDLSFAEDKEQE